MSGLFKPNLNVMSSWKSTLTQAFQTLRRIPFVVEDTMTFQDFDPHIDWNGMTATNVKVRAARYLVINNLMWFSFDVSATLAGAFGSFILITSPKTTRGPSNPSDPAQFQCGGARITTPAVGAEAAYWVSGGNQNTITFALSGLGAFSAGFAQITANGFLEVL